MSSTKARREVNRSSYLPMTSFDDASTHQKDTAVNGSRRHPSSDFRMIPNQADCQVKYYVTSMRLNGVRLYGLPSCTHVP